MGFERYVDCALDVPMYFVKRGDDYIDVAGQVVPRLAGRQARRAAGRARDAVGLGEPPDDDLSPRCGSSGISRCAAPMPAAWRAAAALPAFWVGILYDDASLDAAWDLVEGLDRRGAPEAARRRSAATASRRRSAAAPCSRSRATCLALAHAGLGAARQTRPRGRRRDAVPLAARRDRRERQDARRRAAGEVSRAVERQRRSGLRRIRLLRPPSRNCLRANLATIVATCGCSGFFFPSVVWSTLMAQAG